MELLTFENGRKIPMVGLGVFKSENGMETENAVKWALDSGYTHIDTAMIYKNEQSVGKAIKESGKKREDLFITTKIWTDDIRSGNTRKALETSLKNLDMDYVDLYLIHWAVEGYEQTWKNLEKLYEEGLIKTIGVSNFHQVHFEKLLSNCNIVPFVNQIESHPKLANRELISYCQNKKIAIQAWSPLGGGRTAKEMLQSSVLIDIGKKYGKTPAQVIIRWNIQRNVIVLPKSVHQDRIIQNIDVFDFVLSSEDMEAIFAMDINARVGTNPENVPF